MWCSNCRQDVPGVASANRGGKYCCVRCGEEFHNASAPPPEPAAATAAAAVPAEELDERGSDLGDGESFRTPDDSGHDLEYDLIAAGADDDGLPFDLDDWRLDEDLAAAERLIRTVRARQTTGPEERADHDPVTHHLDAAHRPVRDWHVHLGHRNELPTRSHAGAGPSSAERPSLARDDSTRGSLLAWGALSVGLMAFVCGGVLLGWGFISGRVDLWTLGTPLTLVGVAGLILGMVMQMDGLWQSNRKTAEMLSELDGQLHDLRHTTTLMSTTHSSPAQSFYSHMADGAAPQLLLADLKSQLDMLAVKMSRER